MFEAVIVDTEGVRDASPGKEYLAGGAKPVLVGGYGTVASRVREALHADPTMSDYEDMLLDDKVKPTVQGLVDEALREGIQFVPAIDDAQVDDRGGYKKSEAKEAWKIAQFCERATRVLDSLIAPSLESAFSQLAFSSMVFRASVGEKVYADAPGRDKGKLYLSRLNPKHRSAWRILVDRAGNIRGIKPLSHSAAPRKSGLGLEKVVVMAWDRRDGAVIGTSCLDAAWLPWNFKVQTIPLWWDYQALFSVPNVHLTASETAEDRIPEDADGNPIGSTPVSPTRALYEEAVKVFTGGGRILVTPAGTEVEVLGPPGNHDPFVPSLDWLDRAIVHAIAGTTRATMESQYGSKADSEQGSDMRGVAVFAIKSFIAANVRLQVLRDLVRMNYGEESAVRFLPQVTLGQIDRGNFSRFANALTKMYQVGLITEAERLDTLAFLGVRFRVPPGTKRPAAATTAPATSARPRNPRPVRRNPDA